MNSTALPSSPAHGGLEPAGTCEEVKMDINIKTRKKYLLLIPLVVSLIMLTFFSAAYHEIVREKHEQKFHSLQTSVDEITAFIDQMIAKDDDWETYDYASALGAMIGELDKQPMVYAELLDMDFASHSVRFVEGEQIPFDPRVYGQFAEAVGESDGRGMLTVQFNDGLRSTSDMSLYFREIPSGSYEDKFLIVVGATKYAIDQNFAPWLLWGVVGLVSMTVILQVCMVLYISKLSDAEQLMRKKAESAG